MAKPGRYRRGEAHHRAVLTVEDVMLMRELHRGGLTVSQIWRKWDEFNVAWATVWCVVHYRSWVHVE